MTANPFLAAALDYAARGWPVFPCNPSDKRPLPPKDRDQDGKEIPGSGGVKKASTDPEVIRAWWRKWPKAMIGVATGEAIGAFAVDYDAGVDDDGVVHDFAELRDVLDREIGVALPATWQSQTPRGGRHRFFRASPADMPGNRAGLVPRVDIRGNGGYVILPPSVRADGKAYAWETGPAAAPLAAAPPALLDCVLRRGRWGSEKPAPAQPARRSSSVAAAARAGVSDAVRRYALAALDAELQTLAVATKGTRNDAINRAAFALGSLVAAGALSENEVRAGLEGVIAQWPNARKSRGTVDSGLRSGMAAPRDLSEIAERAAERAARQAFEAALPPPDPADYGLTSSPLPSGGEKNPQTRTEEQGEPKQSIDIADIADIPRETIERCAQLDKSDTDNATRLIAYFGDRLRVMAQKNNKGGIFLHWTSTHWDLDGGAAGAIVIAQRIGELIIREIDHMVALPYEQKMIEAGKAAARELEKLEAIDEEERSTEERRRADDLAELIAAGKAAKAALSRRKVQRRKDAITAKNAGKVAAMLDMFAPRRRLPPEAFNPDPYLVVTRTHTLRFVREVDPENPDPDGVRYRARVDAIAGHRREDLITALIPVDYDPSASCPKWIAFLDRTMPDAGKRRTLQQFTALGLLGIATQWFMYHYGEGANGKSVYLETIVRLLGESFAVGLPQESIAGGGERGASSASPDIARLFGKRLLRVAELKKDVPLQAEVVKKLTGGELVTARDIYKGFFDFRPLAKPHFSGNGFPKIDGTDGGIKRRMLVMHWTEKIPEAEARDFDELVNDLLSEAPGILNWLVAGAVEFLGAGLYVDAQVRAATQDYIDEMDPVGEFIRAHVEAAPGETITARAMYNAFLAWCEANGVVPMKETRFGLIAKTKLKRVRAAVRYYEDVRLHDVPERQGGHDAQRDAHPGFDEPIPF